MRAEVLRQFASEVVYDAGALLTRIQAHPVHDEWDVRLASVKHCSGPQVDPSYAYWEPIIDSAGIPSYAVSGMLFLSTAGQGVGLCCCCALRSADHEGGTVYFLQGQDLRPIGLCLRRRHE